VAMFEVWYTCQHEQICCTTSEKGSFLMISVV